MPCLTNFRDKLPFVNLMKSLIFDSVKILLPKSLVLTYSFICEGYALSDTFYRIEIELLVFRLCPVLFRWSFLRTSEADGRVEK